MRALTALAVACVVMLAAAPAMASVLAVSCLKTSSSFLSFFTERRGFLATIWLGALCDSAIRPFH